MKSSSTKVFWRAVQPLVGSVIGVGIFGLPFVFAAAGYFVGLTHLIVVGLFNLVILFAFTDLLIHTKSKARLTGVIKRYLGEHWSWFATMIAFGATWGAMIAYIIIGGEFLHALFSPVIGIETIFYQILFFVISAFLLIGGLGFIARLEVIFVFALLIMLFVILTGSLPYVEPVKLLNVDSTNWFLPFGVVLFAFGGLAAIPEVSQVLGKQKHKLKKVILTGLGLVAIVYAAFTAVVVAVSGTNTTEEAILGLGAIVGPWATVLGSIIGLFSVLTSFLILGLSVMDTMIYDFKWRYMHSWALAVSVPLTIFMFGARSFIGVIGFTGGILGGLTALIVLFAYLKAKKDPSIAKRSFRIPNLLILITGAVFVFGIIMTALATS